MRIFKRFPETKKCPICGTNENKDSVLIANTGTNTKDSPLIFEAECFHLDCIDLMYNQKLEIIFQKVHNIGHGDIKDDKEV